MKVATTELLVPAKFVAMGGDTKLELVNNLDRNGTCMIIKESSRHRLCNPSTNAKGLNFYIELVMG